MNFPSGAILPPASGAQAAQRSDAHRSSHRRGAVIAVVSLINGANHTLRRASSAWRRVFGLSKQPSIITNVDDWLAFQKRKRILTTTTKRSANSASPAKKSAPRWRRVE